MLLFEKPSARTRTSMEMAVVQLGGHPVTLRNEEVGIDTRESAEDLGRLLSGYGSVIGARVFEHHKIERLAAAATVPVVNLLSDEAHPVQALADLLTVRQEFGTLDGVVVAYVGDANNVARSLGVACGLMGIEFRVSNPPGYDFDTASLDRLRSVGLRRRARAPTPCWRSRAPTSSTPTPGTRWARRRSRRVRTAAFADWQVDEALMAQASDRAIFLHCLPAHRGDEATDGVLDGPSSRIWPQAQQPHAHQAGPAGLAARRGPPMSRATGTGQQGPTPAPHRELLEEHRVTNQAHLVELLAADGVEVNVSTVSRDLEELGAIKVRIPGGETAYAVPEMPREQIAPPDHLRRVLGDWVVEVARSGDLVVVRTPPGSAHVVGSAIDRAGLRGCSGPSPEMTHCC